MGATQSKDNDELVDNLVNSGNIKSKDVQRAFRLVDRGRFFPEKFKNDAYHDAPFKVPDNEIGWSPGLLHLSAPSMYGSAVEKLKLQPGLSFLNIGSGTGWLNTVAGFLLGDNGVNHGIEIYENLVSYANEKLEETLELPHVSAFPWTKPTFFAGNGLAQRLPIGSRGYDRIYCGAAVENEEGVQKLIRLLAINGRLVAPYQEQLHSFVRISEDKYAYTASMNVHFAELIPAKPTDSTNCLGFERKPYSLKCLCRKIIRDCVRQKVAAHCSIRMRIMEKNRGSTANVIIVRPNGDGEDDVDIGLFDDGDGDEQNPPRIRTAYLYPENQPIPRRFEGLLPFPDEGDPNMFREDSDNDDGGDDGRPGPPPGPNRDRDVFFVIPHRRHEAQGVFLNRARRAHADARINILHRLNPVAGQDDDDDEEEDVENVPPFRRHMDPTDRAVELVFAYGRLGELLIRREIGERARGREGEDVGDENEREEGILNRVRDVVHGNRNPDVYQEMQAEDNDEEEMRAPPIPIPRRPAVGIRQPTEPSGGHESSEDDHGDDDDNEGSTSSAHEEVDQRRVFRGRRGRVLRLPRGETDSDSSQSSGRGVSGVTRRRAESDTDSEDTKKPRLDAERDNGIESPRRQRESLERFFMEFKKSINSLPIPNYVIKFMLQH